MRPASGGDVGSRKVSSERDTGRVDRSFTDIIVITIPIILSINFNAGHSRQLPRN